jgi:hypothetical protein
VILAITRGLVQRTRRLCAKLAVVEEGDAELSDNSRIKSTDSTWDPVTGCSKVSPGCGCAHFDAATLSLPLARRYVERLRAAGAGR